MGRKLRCAAVAAAAVATLGIAGNVYGGETNRGGFELALSTQTPGAPAGLGFRVLYKHPDDPEGKPPAVTSAVFELPEGMRIDDTAVAQCTASDDDFRARGRDACPPESHVGDGTLIAMTGVPGADPVTADIVAYNGTAQLIEVVFFKGTNTVAGMDRLTIEDGKLVAHPPATPGGPPDGRTTVREVRLDLPRRLGADGRPYVSAPPECLTGTWTSRAHYEFADGGKTTVPSQTPCTPAATPALHVAVRPRRADAGERTVFRIVASSDAPSCVARARVRFGGRHTRTGAHGRARLTTTFERAGRKVALVSKRGCRRGRAIVRVR